jgi:16S rRNA C967 or C1407 C5-methylase (RsmB/RsmF family)/NOL1/NOP2/fmu family ribosome biogenesis protein
MTLPNEFTTYTRQLMGEELFHLLQEGLSGEAPTSIRVNPFKATLPEDADRVPWCQEGLYLTSRPAFTFDPALHAGLYYVQEAASMFVCEVVRQLIDKPITMLDLCAAPGGKSTALRSVLPKGSLLFTNEPVKNRASILKENIIKFGHPDVIVTNNFPRDYRKAGLMFDAILADVPCSGEGMFRKDPGSIEEWSIQNVEKCRVLQRSIVEDIWPCLQPGGILIYSTCTFNAHEDEENASWIAEQLGAEFITLDIPEEWHITGSLVSGIPACRFIPGKTRGEGLFLTVLRKKGTQENNRKAAKNAQKEHYNNNVHDLTTQWLNGSFSCITEKDFLRAIPTTWTSLYNNVKSKLHILHAGVGLGTIKGKAIVPDASLALSTSLRADAFPTAELSYLDAIRFLRREPVELPQECPRGFVVVTYMGHPLGFEKNLGTRANNLYPQEWKIKSSYIPDKVTHVI